MSFEHYNVEKRDRVKCISAIEGVYFIHGLRAHFVLRNISEETSIAVGLFVSSRYVHCSAATTWQTRFPGIVL